MAVRIITDSGSDLSQKRAEKLGIKVIPLRFRFGEEEYLDGVTMSPKEFYERMEREEELPKTSQISPYTYTEAFKEAIDQGDDVVYVSISSGVSGCFQSAVLAASEFGGSLTMFSPGSFLSRYLRAAIS